VTRFISSETIVMYRVERARSSGVLAEKTDSTSSYDSRLSFCSRPIRIGHILVSDYAVLFHHYNKPRPTPYINRYTQTCATQRPRPCPSLVLPQWTAFLPLILPKPRLTPSSRSTRHYWLSTHTTHPFPQRELSNMGHGAPIPRRDSYRWLRILPGLESLSHWCRPSILPSHKKRT